MIIPSSSSSPYQQQYFQQKEPVTSTATSSPLSSSRNNENNNISINKRQQQQRCLHKFTFRHLCILAVLAPLSGIVGVFALACWLHPWSELFAYEWSCGLTHLPSVSRMLNLPAGRILWNFMISFHFPLGLLITFHYYLSFMPSPKQTTRNPKISSVAELYLRIVFLMSGIANNFFLLFLSVLGERENGELHVIFFCAFLFSTFIHFTGHIYLDDDLHLSHHDDQHHRHRHNVNAARKVRLLFLALLWLLIPILVLCFSLHQLYCAPHSYELFALGEYLTIVAIFCFNSAILLDNHQNCLFCTLMIIVPSNTSPAALPSSQHSSISSQ